MFQHLRKLAIAGIALGGLFVIVPGAISMPSAQDQAQTEAQTKKDTDKAATQQSKTATHDDAKKDTAKDSATDKSSTSSSMGSLSHRGLKGKKPGPPAGTPGEKDSPPPDDKKPQ